MKVNSSVYRLVACVWILLSFSDQDSYGQSSLRSSTTDTLQLSLADAEKRFVEHNLTLLAGKFNISAARAFQVQAGLWENPSLYFEQSIFNPVSGKVFPTQVGEAGNPATQGENIVQINQLILLAGKRAKQVEMAKISAEIAENTFYDVMRSLRMQLRTNFFNVYFLQQSLQIYQEEVSSLQRTANLYQLQYQKGNVALKEVIRLKAFLFTLENDQKNLRAQITESQANLGVLLNDSTNAYYQPFLNKQQIDSLDVKRLSLAQLTENALNNRFDLKAAEAGTRYEKQNLAYQKALTVPDLRLGMVYDRNGSYVQNYYGLSLGIDLPLLNRNQGNIQAAKSRIQASNANWQSSQLQVEKDVWQAYQKSLQVDQLFKSFDNQYAADFNQLIDGINASYQRRNISLLEFIDFYESYKNSVLQQNQLQYDRLQAFEELNYATGTNLFTY
jgi:cobalt-zinc-cadmium efflux system outer membrane protein